MNFFSSFLLSLYILFLLFGLVFFSVSAFPSPLSSPPAIRIGPGERIRNSHGGVVDGDGARVPVTVCDGDVARRERWGGMRVEKKGGRRDCQYSISKKKKKKSSIRIYISSSSCVRSM